ncbi:hypothetical protein [Nocardioides lijunqiniae]|uniref:hypothetical protein n=1 Tax=Nocardioides lijunqiniae TaxID=2760832 RepID=UPI0018778781|nr:hypothetical protein [Nocardioides lijunqiniae]
MNDVRTLFESVLTDPPPDPLDVERVVARGTRRRTVRRAVTGAAGLAAVLVVGGGIALVATPGEDRMAPPVTDPTTAPSSTPPVIDLSARPATDYTCETNGQGLGPPTVIAQPSGVVLRVSSTMPPGSLMGYTYELPFADTGAHRLPARNGTWTMPLAPGKVTLACEPLDGILQEIVLTVTDPDGHWRGDAVEGCEAGGVPEWGPALTGSGPTPEDAVEETLNGLRAGVDGLPAGEADYTARPTESGYDDRATEPWVVLKDGEPYLTIAMASQEGTRFVAMPDRLCG